MHASISVKDLSWSTPDGSRLLSHLNLAFSPGRTGLIGDNGSGKSTLLRILAGELTPLSGDVIAHGRIAMMRQSASGDPGETVADLFDVSADLARLKRIETDCMHPDDLTLADWTIEPRLQESLFRVGLAGLEPGRPLVELSGGESRVGTMDCSIAPLTEPDMRTTHPALWIGPSKCQLKLGRYLRGVKFHPSGFQRKHSPKAACCAV